MPHWLTARLPWFDDRWCCSCYFSLRSPGTSRQPTVQRLPLFAALQPQCNLYHLHECLDILQYPPNNCHCPRRYRNCMITCICLESSACPAKCKIVLFFCRHLKYFFLLQYFNSLVIKIKIIIIISINDQISIRSWAIPHLIEHAAVVINVMIPSADISQNDRKNLLSCKNPFRNFMDNIYWDI